MVQSPDSAPTEEKIFFTEKAKGILSRFLPDKEKHIEDEAFLQPWDEATCLALKTEIEIRPNWIDANMTVATAYKRLSSLLGPPDREGVTPENIKNRIIFADSDTIIGFRYLFEQPGENSDIYWKSPIVRMIDVRGKSRAGEIFLTHAASYSILGMIMIPNEKDLLSDKDKPEQEYTEKQGISQENYPELAFKRIVAHELTHFLFPKGLKSHHFLDEPLVDYMATLVFPEIWGIDVKLAWAKTSINDYLKRLGYKSVKELTQFVPNKSRLKKDPASIAWEIRNKYFSKMSYQGMGFPEGFLNDIKLSKFTPIPK